MKQAAAFIGRELRLFEVIVHEGVELIALSWSVSEREGIRKPVSVLPLGAVRHHVLDTVDPPYHFFLDDPLPLALINGTATQGVRERFGVHDGPDITLPIPAGDRE